MTELYTEQNYIDNNTRRIKYLFIYFTLLAVVLIAEILLLIYFSTRPFGTSLETPLLIIILSIGGVFAAFSVVFFTIPYGRLSKYCNILCDFLDNKRVTSEVTAIKYDENITVKYGVDFYRLNVLEWNETEEEYVERSVLIDNEIKNLDFNNIDTSNIDDLKKSIGFYEKYTKNVQPKTSIETSIKNSHNDLKVIIDQENVTLISTGKINLMDAELNEFLLSYKNMLNKTIKVVMCENITEYDY